MSCDVRKEDAARLGRIGEEKVAAYLRHHGYIIVKRNYRDRFGEVDIVAENRENIVFVEVKTRTENAMVSGFTAITPQKVNRLRHTGLALLQRLHSPLPPRFDAAEVICYTKADGSIGWKLHYLKNAF